MTLLKKKETQAKEFKNKTTLRLIWLPPWTRRNLGLKHWKKKLIWW